MPAADPDLVEGDRIELLVGAPAHGGHCVARYAPGDAAGGLVVFVRHALPGERVVAEITERHRGFLRADAVEVLRASADRVPAPCRYAGPDGCGGCDLQHVAPAAQLRWKAQVLTEQLTRLAGLDADEVAGLGPAVAALPTVDGSPAGLGWRSRIRYTVDAAGRAGLLKHRSYEVVPVSECLIAHPRVRCLPVTGEHWPTAGSVRAIATTTGETAVVAGPDSAAGTGGSAATTVGAGGAGGAGGAAQLRESALGRDWIVPADSFWQVHPAAPDVLGAAVLELLDPRPGERAWDLYGGVGLFAAALAGRVGAAGRVTLVESGRASVAAARANLADLAQVEVVEARVERALARRRVTGPVEAVVLDPPRAGAGPQVVRAVAAAATRAVAYVACDPAALARDVGEFRRAGWRLAAVRGFDCFPMTHHVEAVALLVPAAG